MQSRLHISELWGETWVRAVFLHVQKITDFYEEMFKPAAGKGGEMMLNL